MPFVCVALGCSTRASFGLPEASAEYCKKHAPHEYIDVVSKRCAEPGCSKRPKFGLPESTAEYCKKHAPLEYIDVANKRCAAPGCSKRPSFGLPGSTAKYCKKHALPEHIDVKNKRCADPGCSKRPKFGLPGSTAEYCKKHALPEHVDVKNKRCAEPGCSTRPNFGLPGSTAEYCKKHALPEHIDVVSKRCAAPNCDVQVSNPKYDGHCLRCFCNLFPDKPVARNYKVKEVHVTDFIKTIELPDNVIDVTYDKRIAEGCSRRRPDVLINFGYSVIVIEIDETQHEGYSCENKRTMQIFQDAGSVPVVMIRFNPDAYDRADGTRIKSCFKHTKQGMVVINNKTEWRRRLEILRETIQAQLEIAHVGPFDKEVRTIELFMDGYAD